MTISLYEFAQNLDAGVELVEFLAPQIAFESECTSAELGMCLYWRAEIMMMDAAGLIGAPNVVIGHVDFAMLPTGFADIRLDLEQLSRFRSWQVNRFAPLFDGASVAAGVGGPFSDVEVVMLIEDVEVHELFRGHQIGAWAVAQTIQTMMPSSTGLVAICPHTGEESRDDLAIERIEAINALNHHWKRVGFEPLEEHPHILVADTGGTELREAFVRLHQRHYPTDSEGVGENVFVAAASLTRVFKTDGGRKQ